MSEFVNVSEAAKILGVSRTLVYRAIQRGQLHPLPASPLYDGRGPVRLPRDEVEALAVTRNTSKESE